MPEGSSTFPGHPRASHQHRQSRGRRLVGVALLVSVNACSGPAGRRYPVLGFGWVTLPTNAVSGDASIGIRGATVAGVVVGTAGPWTGLVIGRAETLTVEATTNASAWTEGTLSTDGFRFRVVPISAPTPFVPNHPHTHAP